MRSKSHAPKQESKPNSNYKDMLWVVQNIIIPLEPMKLPTVFQLDEHEILQNLLFQIRRDCPKLSRDPKNLMEMILKHPDDDQ